ncbi:MAG: allophanate hydrolase, partial [Rhodospirillaceae bacterium]|nr:allophanate hydrolase [Rhodospirillaceae bacterium]
MTNTAFWTISDWQSAYQRGAAPSDLLVPLLASLKDGDTAWISRLSMDGLHTRLVQLGQQREAVGGDLSKLPLYGIPFAVKDNINVAGLATTCACPEFAFLPAHNATVVDRLEAAGAVAIGKTNLDQFATGLVGTRSPYGPVPNAFKPEFISGGSSSGSASVVARGLVPFALGT